MIPPSLQNRLPGSEGGRGGVLLATVLALALLAVLAGTALHFIASAARLSDRAERFDRANTDAESALEVAFADWSARVRAGDPTRPLDRSELDRVATPTQDEIPGLDVSRTEISAVEDLAENPQRAGVHRLNGLRVDILAQPAPEENSPPRDRAQGVSTRAAVYRYLATAEVSLPGPGSPVVGSTRAIFEQQIESAWDYALLFLGNLTLTPELQVRGWVHTNGNLEPELRSADWEPAPLPLVKSCYPRIKCPPCCLLRSNCRLVGSHWPFSTRRTPTSTTTAGES